MKTDRGWRSRPRRRPPAAAWEAEAPPPEELSAPEGPDLLPTPSEELPPAARPSVWLPPPFALRQTHRDREKGGSWPRWFSASSLRSKVTHRWSWCTSPPEFVGPQRGREEFLLPTSSGLLQNTVHHLETLKRLLRKRGKSSYRAVWTEAIMWFHSNECLLN